MLNWDDFNADDAQDTHAKTQGPQAHEEASKDEASTERFEVDGYGHEEMVQIQDNILRNMKPVRGEDKRMIGGTSDINQLVPFGHVWAWEKYLNSCANHWMPTEINMSNDIAQWKSDTALTEDERRVIKHCLGFFSTADTIVGNNCMLAIYPYLTSPEARQFIQRQSFEEAMHSHSYQYCIESMGLNQEEIFSLYHHSPAMRAKAAWCLARTKAIQGLEAKKNTIEGDQEFLEMLIAFYVVMEGIFFYCGFPTILSMGRRGKMTGVAEQFQYILRDECLTADTEVLTPDGWIPITQVTYDTSIVQWDKSWGLSYAKPEMLSMTDVDYTYEIKDTRGVVNKRVSGNHRIPHMKQGLRSVQVCTADELIPSSQITLIGYDCKNQLDLAEFRMTYAAGEEVFKTRIDEPTTVYGIQVPSSFILIRREGVVSVTGNSNHLNFGIDVINQIKIENPHLWTPEFQARAVELIRQGTMLEINFARDLLPRGVLGMNATLMEEYLKFIANRRLVQLGLPQLFEGATNPFPWMAEMIDLTKEKNFFETRLNNAA